MFVQIQIAGMAERVSTSSETLQCMSYSEAREEAAMFTLLPAAAAPAKSHAG